ncbi:MAG TPA: hypothetical protein VJN50_08990 [Actinomycetota bacterium]|nr:hypothetical protein [Actinomycetota bacterium]
MLGVILILVGLGSAFLLLTVTGGSQGELTIVILGRTFDETPARIAIGVGALLAAGVFVGVVGAATVWSRSKMRKLQSQRMELAAANARLELRNRLLGQEEERTEAHLEELQREVREKASGNVVRIPEPEPAPAHAALMRDKVRFPRAPETVAPNAPPPEKPTPDTADAPEPRSGEPQQG